MNTGDADQLAECIITLINLHPLAAGATLSDIVATIPLPLGEVPGVLIAEATMIVDIWLRTKGQTPS